LRARYVEGNGFAKSASRNLREVEGLEADSSLHHFFSDFYRWLGHKIVELRIIDTVAGAVVYQDYITDPDVFAEKCVAYNGRAQVYFGIQERDGKGGKYENVPSLTFIPIDVDATRSNKKTEPANATQRLNAQRNLAKILKYLKSHEIRPSLVIDTGNGFLVLIRIPRQDTTPHFYKTGDSTQNVLSDMVNHWLQHEVKPLCDSAAEIDSVGDLPRILGVPNTVNMKGMRVRRVILGDVTKPLEPQPTMWRLIEESWKRRETKEASTVTTTVSQGVDALMAMLPSSLREAYKRPAVGERSDVLVRTLLHLANKHGLAKDECVAAMELLTRKIGRERWPAAQQYDKLLAEGKIRPSTFSLGEYTVRVKKDLALIYRGDEPVYPIEIRKLKSTTARKSLAKSLGVDVELVHPVAAKLLELVLSKRKPPAAEQKPSTPTEVEKRAVEILDSQDPIEFIADTVQRVHIGDREKSKLIWLGTITPGLGYELNIIAVGTSGVGKSDIIFVVLCCVPDESAVRLKECSPKAIYYAVKAGVKLDNAIIYFDDVPDQPDTVKTLKDITSENRANPRLWSVTKDRELIDVELPESFAVMASAVTNLTDEGGQIVRRYIVLNPEENPEVNKPILEHIKNEMRMGHGKRYLPPEFEVAKEVTRIIREADVKVVIPFDFEYPDYGVVARSELKQFCALIWAVAKARFKRRLKIGEHILAEPEDFETARELWDLRQVLKLDETARRILEQLGDEEPQQEYDEKGRPFGFSPDPVTSTIIAKKLEEKPRVVQDKLKHLFDMGYVDRKAVGGRGNPYAYWKSPAYLRVHETRESLSPIRLKEDASALNDLYAKIRHSNGDAEKVWKQYLDRFNKQVSILSLENSRKSSEQEEGFFKRKEEANSRVSETRKSLGFPPSEWEGFHAIGPMATPEKNHRKTVNALLEYAKIEKTNVISDTDLAKLVAYYWIGDSHERVKQKLVDDGYLRPFGSGKFLIAENPEAKKEPSTPGGKATATIVSKLKPAFPSIEENTLSGPYQVAGELYHKGVCSTCKRETQISFYALDPKGQRHELCSKCAHEINKERIIHKLEAEWSGDATEEEVIDRLVQAGLTPTEAKHFFDDQLAGNLLFWYDRDGRTLWRWA